MSELRDAILEDLQIRGVLLTRPAERIAAVDEMLRSSTPQDRLEDATWILVMRFLDHVNADNPGLRAANLVAAIRSAVAWRDLLDSAERWERRLEPKATYPSHYDYDRRIPSTCAHGKKPAEWCDECAAGGRIEPQPAPSQEPS